MNTDLMEKNKLWQIIQGMNIIDDDFFQKVSEDKEVCEEIIQAITGDESIRLKYVEPQKYLRNCGSRSVCVDVLCTAEDGKRFAIEMQKKDIDDHQRRVRYEGSNVDTVLTEKGILFEDIPDVYMIYITKFDLFHKGCELYHVARIVRESGEWVNNGFYEIYMNTQVEGDSKVAKLAKYMVNTNGDCPEFPQLSRRVKYLKEPNGGMNKMCEAWENLAKEYAERYVASIWDELEADARKKGEERAKAEVTEKLMNEVTEKVTNEVTEKVTNEVTEKVTNEVTEKIVEEKAKSFLQKGVSLEIVLACIQEISAERIREIYASVVG